MYFNLKIAIRNFIQKPIYTAITFIGFTVSIAAVLLVYIWISNELSYEKFHPDYERIYRVITLSRQGDKIIKSAGCYRPIAKSLKNDHSQIEFATYINFSSEYSPLHIKGSDKKIEAREAWTDNDFFSIFSGFKFIEGSEQQYLNDPYGIALSEKVAFQLFGNETALGKTVIMDKYSKTAYTVNGVVRIPNQSHINFGYILPEANYVVKSHASTWSDKVHVHVYIKMRENAKINHQFINRVSKHITYYSNKTERLMFQPLADIHLHSDYKIYNYDKHIGSYKYVLIFSFLAIIILLMASFNFSLLTVARASERTVEIGVEKTVGANRLHIVFQFLGESVFQTFGATSLAFVIVHLCLPFFNIMLGQQLILNWSLKFISVLVLLTFLTSVLAGALPSLYLSLLKPSQILRGSNSTGSKMGFVRILITVQFCIAIFFITTTFLFIKQMNYIKNKDLGLNKTNIIVVPTGLWYDSKPFKDELMKNPNIKGVTASAYAPVDFGWPTTLSLKKQEHIDSIHASLFWVDEGFAKTYKLEVVKGNFLQMDYETYWKENNKYFDKEQMANGYELSFPVVINQTAEKRINSANIIGQRFGNYVVVGVVKDFHFRPLHHKITPVILTNDPQNMGTMNIRIANNNKEETIKYIKDIYRKHRNDRAFSYSFFDDLIDQKYAHESRLQNLIMMFAVLTIILCVLGILGMSYYTCERRIKEIGLRKVNGATTFQLLQLINKEFIIWLVLAFIIASPIAFFALSKWLEGFAYKTTLNWWIFALAGCIAMGIALITVSWQTFRAARRNPVEALRYE